MPSVIGYSKREIEVLAEMLGLNLKINGNGYVTSQSILENTVLNEEKNLEVTLSLPFQEDDDENNLLIILIK